MTRRTPLLVVLTYGAGLVAGLSHFWAPVAVIGVLLLARRDHRTWAVVLALGWLGGMLAGVEERRRCARRLPEGRMVLLIEPRDPVRQGLRRGRVALPGLPCRGTVTASWSRRIEAEDAVVRAAVRWRPSAPRLGRAGGLLVVDSVVARQVQAAPVVRLRGAVLDVIDRLYGPRAPVVHALLLNRKDGLDRDLRDAFARAGMIHLLAISGFHVGVVMLWAALLLRAARLGRRRAVGGAAVVVLLYVALLGWPPAATRASLLATLYAVQRLRQRHVGPTALVATTCLIMLLADPWVAMEPGAWLSVAAFGGVLTFDAWAVRTWGNHWLLRTLAGSLGATLATAPFTAALFGVVSLVGLVLNVAAMPLAAVTLPALFASVLLSAALPPIGEALAVSGGALLGLLQALARWGGALPGGHVAHAPTLTAGVPWLAALAGALWLIGTRNTVRESGRRALWIVTGVSWAWLGAWPASPAAHTGSHLTLHFLDVRQGDGVAIRTPGGHWLLVDGGPRSSVWDAGRQVVLPFLRRHGVRRLTALLVSHADADHLGGVPSILGELPATLVVEPGATPPSPLYLAFLEALARDSVAWHAGRRGDRFAIDGVSFTVLHPDTAWSGWGQSVNEDSLVLLVEYGAFAALLTGDVGLPVEASLAGHVGRVDVLKVGHHGSRGSTGGPWLEETRPTMAVISVGPNRYGHPAPEVVDRLERHGVALWRTDRDGTVRIRTDGVRYHVEGRVRRAEGAAGVQALVEEES